MRRMKPATESIWHQTKSTNFLSNDIEQIINNENVTIRNSKRFSSGLSLVTNSHRFGPRYIQTMAKWCAHFIRIVSKTYAFYVDIHYTRQSKKNVNCYALEIRDAIYFANFVHYLCLYGTFWEISWTLAWEICWKFASNPNDTPKIQFRCPSFNIRRLARMSGKCVSVCRSVRLWVCVWWVFCSHPKTVEINANVFGVQTIENPLKLEITIVSHRTKSFQIFVTLLRVRSLCHFLERFQKPFNLLQIKPLEWVRKRFHYWKIKI